MCCCVTPKISAKSRAFSALLLASNRSTRSVELGNSFEVRGGLLRLVLLIRNSQCALSSCFCDFGQNRVSNPDLTEISFGLTFHTLKSPERAELRRRACLL